MISEPIIDLTQSTDASDFALESGSTSTLACPVLEPVTTERGTTPTVVTITTATSTLVQRDIPPVALFPPTVTIDDDVITISVPQTPLQYSNVNASSSSTTPTILLPPSSSNKTNCQSQQLSQDWQLNPAASQSYNSAMYPQAMFYGHPLVGVRGPRHGSGKVSRGYFSMDVPFGHFPTGNSSIGFGPSRLRGGSHLGFAGGGSERELFCEVTKDNVKRWSLAGTNPEFTLLRVKLEDVQRELSDLRSKHESKLNDYQCLLNQLEFCRETKNQLETDLKGSRTEIVRLKTDYDRLLQQKQLLDRQVRERDSRLVSQDSTLSIQVK